ncbi:MAG: undecaprenyldiphospho-muramoylpentapeptide beta-N-acetylglucosaminyltransferase [Bacteroidales bacterium]|nr:undecaprenyldiphospho-muramoylpentapeptide beta-N-acetylglucosaminyltransferase [Bacteroidales bacterium]
MKRRIILSGGGTGGHIFPAIAIAKAVQEECEDMEILFVGAKGRMEMIRVPEAGFRIEGLDIQGLQRKITLKNIVENLKLPFRLYLSMQKAKAIIRQFSPDAVVGVGGYASGPTLKVAASMHIPTLIQEQNSCPGITNRMLAQKVDKICTAYDNMERFFPPEKTVKTGNPVRKDILSPVDKKEACAHFQLEDNKKTLAVIGGSLGSLTLNESLSGFVEELVCQNIQLIWQTGASYYKELSEKYGHLKGIRVFPFVAKMDYLYAAADVVVSRAGALALSELCAVAKPCILIPSPNVSEDHQTKNANVLADAGAALQIPDNRAKTNLQNAVFELMNNETQRKTMSENLQKLALPNAAKQIANEIINLINNKK